MSKLPENKTSRFITILAWTFIGIFGYTTAASLIQIVVFLLKPPLELLKGLDTYELILEYSPSGILYYLKHLYLKFALASFLLSLLSLLASLAFLKRKDWARIVLTIIMILPIFICVSGMFFHHFLLLPIPSDIDMQEIVRSTNRSIELILLVFAVFIVILHTWLAYKLLSRPVREEFRNSKSGKGLAKI